MYTNGGNLIGKSKQLCPIKSKQEQSWRKILYLVNEIKQQGNKKHFVLL
uniref:Uncharacterized protein n=1 Tax=Tetranychus urticae TaxID=32264 RepID=T1KBM1_TETUR